MKNYYRILGLDFDAENEEIKAAYRILAQRFHPDKGGDPAEFRIIQEAYDILSNPLTKRPYDRDLFAHLEYQPPIEVTPLSDSHNLWLWAVILFAIIGISFAGYMFWQQRQSNKLAQAIINANNKALPVESKVVITQPPTPAKVKRKRNKSTASGVSSGNTLSNLSGIYYLVNVGSYTTADSAEAKQQSLLNQGVHASIQKINANSEGLTSYNVFVGPYTNQSKAYAMQDQLESQNIDATVQMVDGQ